MRPYNGPVTGVRVEAARWLLVELAAPRPLPEQRLRASQVSSLCLHSVSVSNNTPTTALLDGFGKNAVE